ncbi:hypothetical protein BCEN4_1230004 [Burkholderia cenocepacia]|nr:hypothetical protein BCEN4_1230004 [Burkholderia cenocepacia]
MRGTADLPRGADRAARARRPLEQGDRARPRARATDDQDAPDAHVPQARRVEPHGAGRRAVPVSFFLSATPPRRSSDDNAAFVRRDATLARVRLTRL